MTLRSYLWGMRTAAALSIAVWILIINQMDPELSGAFGKLAFYSSLFLSLSGIFILLFTAIRLRINHSEEIVLTYLGISFRQGILLSSLAIVLLFMQSLRILTWWDSLLAVAGVLLIELYFLTRK